jgi:hypothetical protein
LQQSGVFAQCYGAPGKKGKNQRSIKVKPAAKHRPNSTTGHQAAIKFSTNTTIKIKHIQLSDGNETGRTER